MQLAGLFLAVVIGVILGLIGGGGSILTVPLVEYFFGESTYSATTYSLIVVTVASLFGVFQRIGKQLFAVREALIFVVPSMIVAFFIRAMVLEWIPQSFFIGEVPFSRDFLLSVLLALVMLFVAFRMMRPMKELVDDTIPGITKILLMGALTGALSGFLGAGGGFIIVPILMGMGLEIRKAVATSMLIIVIQSVVALMGDVVSKAQTGGLQLDWKLVFYLSALSVLGVFIGTLFQQKVTGKFLRRMFATVLIVVATGILADRIL